MLDSKLRTITKTGNDQYKPYNRYGDDIPGMSWLPLSGELQNGEFECFLLRMDPGARSKPHEHMGFEEFYMVEGVLIDFDGREFSKGDFVSFKPGSKHSSHTPDGCLLLVMLRGTNRSLSADEIAADAG